MVLDEGEGLRAILTSELVGACEERTNTLWCTFKQAKLLRPTMSLGLVIDLLIQAVVHSSVRVASLSFSSNISHS